MRLAPDARVAVYYAPDRGDPLWQAGSAWLGRDATGATAAGITRPCGLQQLTEVPRLYGFHATLKPPFRLRQGAGWADVLRTARALCRAQAQFALPELVLGVPKGFLALVERHRSPPLRGLADLLVQGFDHLRAPATPAELARRRTAPLNQTQEEMLGQWGYPAVFGLWRFHMTLSQHLTQPQQAHYLTSAQPIFAPACAVARRVQDICLFVQPGPCQEFRLAERIALG